MNPCRKIMVKTVGVATLVLIGTVLADYANAQQTPGAQSPVTKEDVIAACSVDRRTQLQFGVRQIKNGQSDKILDLETAVRARRDAQIYGKDRLNLEVKDFQVVVDRLEKNRLRNPRLADPYEECARRYLALLQSLDAPSLERARAEAEKESADRIERKRQERLARQAARDEAAAEQARRKREAEVAKAQEDEERRQRAAAERKQALADAAAELERQKAETARAEAEAAERKKVAEAAAAIAELKRKQEMVRMEAAKAEQKQQAAEQAAREAQRQAEDAARKEREATAKVAQEAQATAQREAESQIADRQGSHGGSPKDQYRQMGSIAAIAEACYGSTAIPEKLDKLMETATKQNPATAPVINLLIEEYNVAYYHAVATMTVWNGSAQSYSDLPFSCANGKDVKMIRAIEATVLKNLQ